MSNCRKPIPPGENRTSLAMLTGNPHRRFNPLTREWVLVSPHRTQRPWQGQVEKIRPAPAAGLRSEMLPLPRQPARRRRAQSRCTTSTFVFDNDFAALKPDTPLRSLRARRPADRRSRARHLPRGLLLAAPRSHHRQHGRWPICARWWTPGSSSSRELGARRIINYVQIFENRGAMMGASNPHPHCQIWASHASPTKSPRSRPRQLAWRQRAHGSCLLCDYAAPGAHGTRAHRGTRTTPSWRWCPSGPSGRSRRW